MKDYKTITNYLFASFIAQGSYFILIPLIINFLGDEVFADIELFNVYSSLCFKILALNICSAITKYKYDSINKEDYLDFSSNIFGFGVIITILSCFISVSIIFINPSFWKLNNSLTALVPLAIFYLFSEYWAQNYFVTQKKITKYRNFQILVGITKIISIGIIIFIFEWLSAFGKILFEFIFLSILSLLFICSEKIKIKRYRFKIDVITALKFSSPLIIWVIVNNLLNYSDQIFISNYFDKSALAIYSIGYRVGMIVVIFYVAISNYFTINFFENYTNSKHNEKNTLKIIFIIFLFTLLMLVLGPIYIEYSTKWLGSKLVLAIKINKIIIFSYFINIMFLLYSRKLFFLGKTFKISFLACAVAITNVILNLMFLKNSTILIAAYTTLLSYSILALTSVYYMIKEDREFSIRPVILFVFLSSLLILIIF